MSNPSKSLIARLVSDHADSLAVRLRDWDKLEKSLDSNYEVTTDEKGNIAILRKQTRQLVDMNVDQFFKLVARNHVNDLSFGKFRSQFTPRTPDTAEMSKTKALLDHSKFHFTNQQEREKLEGFILKNFIPDGNDLRKLDPVKGMVSTKSFTPDEILMQYGREIIDPDRSELLRLEAIAELRDKATWLAGGEVKTAERLLGTLQKVNAPSFEKLTSDLLDRQSRDTEARAMASLGILDKSAATLQELNAIEIRKKQFIAELDMLPVRPNE